MELTSIFEIRNKLGLHAKAAGTFVQITNKYSSDCYVKKDDIEVNGKSIMGLMMLAASKGTKILIRMKGDDAKEAMKDLGNLIKRKFDEEE
jgi:phosphocarrier protein